MKFKRFVASALALTMAGSIALPMGNVGEVKAAEMTDSEWENIQSIVSRYYGEWRDTRYTGLINNEMPNTALLGNGDVGVASGGNSQEKKFYVSKGDFWVSGFPDTSHESGILSLGGVTIREKEEEQIETGTNLAPTYKNVTASSVLGEAYPENAVDGSVIVDNGIGADQWVSKLPKEQGSSDFWLQLEFEEPITIARYVVKSDWAVRPDVPGIEANTTKDFKLQVSDTGEEGSWIDADSVVGNTEGVFDKNLESSVTAKFVRLYITKATQETTADTRNNPRARIAQLELYAEPKEQGEETEEANLAFNKPLEVSSRYAGEAQGTLVDGDYDTQWTSASNVINAPEHWAIVDLGEEKNIGCWIIRHSPETGCATSDFKLQYSNDKTSWTDFAVVEGNTELVSTGTLENPISARYVRLLVTKGTQTDNSYARIRELELYEEYVEPEEPFYEKQDILNAEIQTKQRLGDANTEMTTWVASDKNLMVTELVSNSSTPEEMEVETWAVNSSPDLRPVSAVNDENSVTVTRTAENRCPEDPDSWVSKAALSTTVIGTDIIETESDTSTGKGTLSFLLQPGEKVYVVTAVGGGGRTYTYEGDLWDGETEPEEEALTLLGEASSEGEIQDLNTERQNWWKDYWSASYIDFGTEDAKLDQIQKYYYGAQYILGSTIREGKIAPGLYGIWRVNDTPKWGGGFTLNYNFMSTFYGVNSSNRPEQILPAADFLFSQVETGVEKAGSTEQLRKINSDIVDKNIAEGDIDPVNGIQDAILFFAVHPWGQQSNAGALGECLSAGYNSYLLTQYYEYTLDDSILEQTYDYLKKCANFYEAWLLKEDGRYNLYAGWCEAHQGKNPATELATVQHIFKNVISMSEILGVDEDKRPVWEEIYEDISIKPTWTADGKTVYGLAEKRLDGEGGETDFNLWGQRYSNVVMLDYFLPGDSLGYFSTPEELQIARDTIDIFDTNTSANTAWNNANNFPRVYPDAVRARYDIDQIINHLYQNISGSKMAANLRIVDGNHGVEKCGATEAINSMMLITDKGITKIFPNWYTDKDAKFSSLRAKGAFTVSAEYDGTAQEAKNVTITSEEGADMTLVSPWAEGMTVKDSKGNIIETTKGTVPNWEDQENATYTFATTAGETYTVEKGETATEKPSKNTLEYFLNKAKEHQANGDVDNCVESIKNLFAEAIAEGEAVMADENATCDEVMDATVKLMKAIQALDMKAADKTDLEMAVELAESIDLTKYVEAGQAEFQQALAAAQEVIADGDAMQADADAAWNALVDAISNLRLKADKSTLEDLLNSVADLDLSQYTEESAAVFRTALANAQVVLADETLTEDDQKTVDDAVQALSEAKDQLQLKDTSGGDGNNNTGDGSENTGNGDGNIGNGDSQTPGNGGNSGNTGNTDGNSGNNNAGNSNAKADAPKTGDTAIPFVMLTLATAAGAVAVISGRKKQSR